MSRAPKPSADTWIEVDRGTLTALVAAGALLDLPFATKVGGVAAFTGFVLARTWAPLVAIRH